ncbi:hypothetical protein MLD38_017206 [Melastoma candidum]|uniref:Uncharacterized protein n=1 Tax=Melastoma candidum TaxID=119954 RepID=A0ACB9QTD9_9MYRT|nr:hypothetical protein MLD38_017206 [Melastoma candidum]
MEWCSHCMKSVGFNYTVENECTFWSCTDCGKILGSVCMDGLGQKLKVKTAKGRLKKAAKETLARTSKSSSTEGNEGR